MRWSALDPAATSLGLLELDAATTVEQGIEVLQKAAGPPLQALLADSNGHIGWTLCGAIPRRIGFDGSRSVSWSDGAMSWSGYVEPGGLPMLVDPPSGRLMAANNRVIGEDQSLIVGHNFASGYRAYRIARRLQGLERATERDLLAVQLDDTSDFYLPYLALALECLGPEQHAVEAWANDTREALRTWSGRADTDQISITILARFRERLIDKVLKPLMAQVRACRSRASTMPGGPWTSRCWRCSKLGTGRASVPPRLVSTGPAACGGTWRERSMSSLKRAASARLAT